MMAPIPSLDPPAPHPRTLGWIGTTALAMGGSNQSLFLLAALFAGQGDILGQGSAAVPLLIVGLLLAWAAAPGWTELVLMFPNRVGGIAATCAEAFRPYSPVLANLTGVCYWWGWVPTCGLTAILSASAIHAWYLPEFRHRPRIAIVALFTLVNLLRHQWVTRLAVPIATASALLALMSGLAPIAGRRGRLAAGHHLYLTSPFEGWFGQLTSLMAGLYLIGFAAPAFEAAACHVGETIDPEQERAARDAGQWRDGVALFVVLPVVWLGVLGPRAVGQGPGAGPRPDVRAGVRQRRQGGRHLVHDVQHVPRHAAAAGRARRARCRSSPKTACCRASSRGARAPTRPGSPPADRRHGHPVPADRRPDLAGRGRQFHLPDRHRPAQRRGLAVATRCARAAPALSGAARNHRPRPGRGHRLGPLGAARLPAVRAADGADRAAFAYSGSALYAWRKFTIGAALACPAWPHACMSS